MCTVIGAEPSMTHLYACSASFSSRLETELIPSSCSASCQSSTRLGMNKGKTQKDRRKLREKRRSTGILNLPSTESTGDSTGEDDIEIADQVATVERETDINTQFNELQSADVELSPLSSLSQSFQEKIKAELDRDDSSSESDVDQEDNGMSIPPSPMSSQDLGIVFTPAIDKNISRTGSSSHLLSRESSAFKRTSSATILALEEENKKLATLLELKNRQVQALEVTLKSLRSELQKADVETVKLRQENSALIKGMASLTP